MKNFRCKIFELVLLFSLFSFGTILEARSKILPPCPPKCELRIYGPIKGIPYGFPKDALQKSEWTKYYKSAGVGFAKGGFAYYYPPTKTLIIAGTEADFDLIETEMAP